MYAEDDHGDNDDGNNTNTATPEPDPCPMVPFGWRAVLNGFSTGPQAGPPNSSPLKGQQGPFERTLYRPFISQINLPALASSLINLPSRLAKKTLPFQTATPLLTTSQQAFLPHDFGTNGS